MATRMRQIEDEWVKLPERVYLEKKKGRKKSQIVVVHWENGKRIRSCHPATLEGLELATAEAKAYEQEEKKYGSDFGNITKDEKMAIDYWRNYKARCDRECCKFIPMSELVNRALAEFTQETITPYFKEVSAKWVEMMRNKNLNEKHFKKSAGKVVRFNSWFGDIRISKITVDMVEEKLNTLRGRDGEHASPRTIRDYIGCIQHIFSFALKRDIIMKNPIRGIDKPKLDTPERETISVEDAITLLSCLINNPTRTSKSYFVGFVINLFCGVRPGELSRLKFKDLFNGGRNEIYLTRAITKTDFDRRAVLRKNVVSWIKYFKKIGLYRQPEDYIIGIGKTEQSRADNYSQFLGKIAKRAGVTIPRDAIRHTAATMISALEGMRLAAEELGNDVRILVRHYRHAVTKDEALAFFSISPTCLTLAKAQSAAKKLKKVYSRAAETYGSISNIIMSSIKAKGRADTAADEQQSNTSNNTIQSGDTRR